jgi:replicative DNA helicase
MESNALLDQLKKATENKLSGDFVIELIKCCFTSQKIFDICKQHLKYHYLQSEAQKKIVQFLFDSFEVNNVIPTIGIVGQSFTNDKDVIALLSQIKKIEISNDLHDAILSEFESWIKKSKFIALYNKVGELFNQGKQENATNVLAKESAEIVSFQLKETYYTTVFGDFDKRQEKRLRSRDNRQARYCVWGIHELDDTTRGIEYGRSALIMARSGGGKSTMMKWTGLANARLGKRVLHFQAEGTEEECNNAYDAAWTGSVIDDIEMGSLPKDKQSKIKKAHKDILSSGGEIIVYAAEQFDSLSIQECREIAKDVESIHGEIDLIIFDYLPKFTISSKNYSGEHGERRRRLDIGDKMTNTAVEFNCAVLTAVQADDVKPSEYNKPDFVMKRSNISENKAQTEPFSYFITINQTDEEYENGIARLYIDKARKCKRGKTIRIYQALDRARFYDSVRSLQTFYQKVV